MSKIKHESMSQAREVRPNTPQPQTYVVDDPTAQPRKSAAPAVVQSVEDRLAEFEKRPEPVPTDPEKFALPPKKKVSDLLEKLIFVGRTRKEVEIEGVKFVVSTLSNKEHGEMVKALYRFQDAADLFTVRVLTLGQALRSIDGVELDDIEIDGEFESPYQKRMSLIDMLQISVVEKLFDEYESLLADEEEATKDEEKDVKNS